MRWLNASTLKALEDRSIALVNRMPTVVAVSRRGNLLTVSQGLGPWLLRGDLKCKDRRERLKTFNVGRATLQSRLAITPDRVEGTPDEILDRIVTMFLEWTAAEEETPTLAVAEPMRESQRTTVDVKPADINRSHGGGLARAADCGPDDLGRSRTAASGAVSGNGDASLTNLPGAFRNSAAGARPGEIAAVQQQVILAQRGRLRRLHR